MKVRRRGRFTRPLLLEKLEGRRVLAADIPLAGDFDGNGVDSFGFYDETTGTFFFRNQDYSGANRSGFASEKVRFGPAGGVKPVVGDWDGDGDDTPGVYDPATGSIFLKNDLNPGAADIVFRLGPAGTNWQPLAGDFDGDGDDTIALYDPANGKFHGRNTNADGPADFSFGYGPKGQSLQALANDWDGDGDDTFGLYDQAAGKFFLRDDLAGGFADEVARFGPKNRNWRPIAGLFENDATPVVTVALQDPVSGKIFVSDDRAPGAADFELFVAPTLDRGSPNIAPLTVPAPITIAAMPQLTAGEVEILLKRAAAASASEDAIIAVVDRGGRILGVRMEADVLTNIPDAATRAFAIDGAVAKARTAAFFANGDPTNVDPVTPNGTLAPLNSRLVRFISQTTITQREVESNPNSSDPQIRGPGFVAPIGLGGHFPPEVNNTPLVDLFAIEHTNRDSIVHPGPDGRKSTITLDASGNPIAVSGDDILLTSRFNVDPAFIPPGQELDPPESYGLASGLFPTAQSRGIATLPGGIPLYRDGRTLIGGIGVFFPGTDGFATHEQAFNPAIDQSEFDLTNAPRVLESEWIAFAAAGGTPNAPVDDLAGCPAITRLPFDRLTLVGIELEVFGPHPDGLWTLMHVGASVGIGDPASGADQPIDVMGTLHADGEAVPEGWLVLPHDSPTGEVTAAQVEQIIYAAIEEANKVRAAVRLPQNSATRMVFSVADRDGNVLGLYRMKDATVFSIDVAVAKSRNTAYHADPTAVVAADLPAGIAPGVAFTNRTYRFLADPRYPDGIDGTPPAPYSMLNDPGIDPLTGRNTGTPTDASLITSVKGFDAFNVGRNFRDPSNIANQNGIVFFPGSTPIYAGGSLIGGFGVSGDGVDQDDVVTFFGAQGFLPPPSVTRADEAFVRDVRLPFIKFLRNPEARRAAD